jgi:hypothetical protein
MLANHSYSRPVTGEWILAIEAEARADASKEIAVLNYGFGRADALREAAKRVRALRHDLGDGGPGLVGYVPFAAVLAILGPSDDPA